MISYRLVLGTALVTAVISAAAAAALASFATGALPRAVHRQLGVAPGTSILVTGTVNAAQAAQDGQAVSRRLRAALRPAPVTITSGRYSNALGAAGPPGHSPAAAATGTPSAPATTATVSATGAAAGPGVILLAEAAALDGQRDHAVLTAGQWPGPPAARQPVPAAVPAVVAARLRLAPGTVLRLRDRNTGAPVTLRITGIFRARAPQSRYWQLSPAGPGGFRASAGFLSYGPLLVDPAAFAAGGLATGGAGWLAAPATGRIPASGLTALADRVSGTVGVLTTDSALGGLAVRTSLPAVLTGLSRSQTAAQSLLAIEGLQLLLLAAAALALAASLLAGQREGETALLSARGGARWQLARLNGPESVLLAVAAAAAGALGGGWLAGQLARSGSLRAAGLRLPAGSANAWWAAAAVGVLGAVLLIWPALRPPSPGAARSRRGRQARVAGIARAGADVALVVIALIAGWQLRRYLAVSPGAQGGLGLDPFLIAAPVLALAAGTVLLLRLVPVAARLGDWAASRGRQLPAAMASWEISRRPVRQGACVLLVVLATATSTLALAQHQSWRRSAADQAAFRAGADLRVDLAVPASLAQAGRLASAPGVTGVLPLARSADATSTGVVLAVSARAAPATVLLRPDLAPAGPASLWRRLQRPPAGLAVPGRPSRLVLTAALARKAGTGRRKTRAATGTLRVSLDLTDATGAAYQVPAGTLPPDGRVHRLTAVIPGRQAAYPLLVTGLVAGYTLPRRRPPLATLEISGLAADGGPPAAGSGGGRGLARFADGQALLHWATPMSAPGLDLAVNLAQSPGSPPAGAQGPVLPTVRGRALVLAFSPGYGASANPGGGPPSAIQGTLTLTPALPARPVPALATRGYLNTSGAQVGDILTLNYGPATVHAKIVAAVSAFPTVLGGGGALIIDLPTLQSVLTAQSQGPLPVPEWWLRSPGPAGSAGPGAQSPPGLPGLPAGARVTSRAALTARLLADPLSGLPQQALPAIALAAVVIAGIGFSVSVTAGVTERRAQSALLAALGVSRAARAGQLCLEQLMLSVPAAAAGVLLGGGLARLLVRAVTLTSNATVPIPPVLIETLWVTAVALAAAVAAVPVLAAALTITRRPDPAAELRAAEAT
jgi:hypothetical protein